jgi:outer membrane lipoprotein LolB
MFRGGLRRGRASAAALVVTGLLGACAAPPTGVERSYAGRFAVVATQGETRDSLSGRFALAVRGQHQTLDLATPLGTTVARIEVGPDGARAVGPQLNEVRGPDADALAEQLLGWRLPVSGLADWLERRPVPSRPSEVQRSGQQIVRIDQDGWTIRFDDAGDNAARPRRLILERAATPLAPRVDLRLVIDEPDA